jgi:putative hydrolase of the HAD superfamily
VHYGTTLGGLLHNAGLTDPEEFMYEVHPNNIESFIEYDSGLRPMLAGIDIPKSIFTNSPSEHAERVLDYFGIKDCFREIFDIRFSRFVGKPHIQSYRNVLSVVNHPPEHVLFIDDSGSYLEGYQRLGGPVLQIRENGVASGDWPCLQEIKELPRFLSSRSLG